MGDVDPLPGSAPPPTETDSKADPLVETFERLGGTRELVAERGCSASSNLPFNLGACQCDGAILGELVGAEACRQVVARCSLLVGFSADISIGEVQNSCDKLAADSCIKSAQDVGLNNSICLSILQNGDGRCDDAMAKQLFEEEVTKLCRPACPDCSRLN